MNLKLKLLILIKNVGEKKNETIYFSNNKKEKLNILMAITKDKIYHYKLNLENTTSKN